MPGYYDLWTVSLSFAIATLAGFAAFESVRHARNSGRRTLWKILSGVVLGFGIWSMHFVGMLAWVPPFPLFYSARLTAASLAAAVLASLVAMYVAVGQASLSRFHLALGAVSVGTGISAMHYIGMSALHFSIPEMWSVPWIATSCFIAVMASLAALVLLNRSDREEFGIRRQVFGALAIGFAICGMHYSGMHAMMLHPGTVALQFPGDTSGPTLARLGVGNTLIFTFCLLVISYHDRLQLLRTAHDAEIRAQDAASVAEQLSAAGRVAASIAHEVNNPLEAVTNLIYLAEQTETSSETRSYLQQAQSELRRVSEITTHTLKFYRQQHAAAPASLPELVDSALLLFAGKLKAQQISVSTHWEAETPLVECREGEIRQVIANLVGNAIDAMPIGGALSISLEARGPSVELAVSDTGIGISQEGKEKLFEPFFTTKGIRGTGLGLSISAEILKRHGGTVTFESRTEPPNRGTTFRITLPTALKQETQL